MARNAAKTGSGLKEQSPGEVRVARAFCEHIEGHSHDQE
jgi:hypothetical protein